MRTKLDIYMFLFAQYHINNATILLIVNAMYHAIRQLTIW